MSLAAPTKLGRYEIVEEIGKGAMGVVYLAKDPLIGRLVALKTFRVGYSTRDHELEQFRHRFVREAQSAGILSHPNIVTIHDVVDEGDDGVCFIAMEYVRGTNLKMLLQRPEPFDLEFVMGVVIQVSEGLSFAHSKGVIHRDVKPANILITPDNRVKITDFGIARLNTSNLTLEGQLLGTPNYMSPEQIQGKEVDPRSDLFSLGVVLYEMLTRRKPFQGENLTVVTHRIVHEPFTPPEQYATDLPPGLGLVLGKCLEKDPVRRYQSGDELAEDLRRLLARFKELNDTQATQEVAPVPALPPTKLGWRMRWRERRETAKARTAARAVAPAGGPTESGERAVSRADSGAIAVAIEAPEGQVAVPSVAPADAGLPPPPPPLAAPMPAEEPPPPPPASSISSGRISGALSQVTSPLAPSRAISPMRLVALVLGSLAVLAVAGLVALLGFGPQEPAAQQPSADQQLRIQALPLLKQGRQLLDAGHPAEAVPFFTQAEHLLPADEEVHRLRQEADRLAREQQTAQNVEAAIAASLERARQAVSGRHWDDALAAAREVLALRADQAEALEIVSDVEAAQARQRERVLKAKASEVSTAPAPAAPPAPVEAAPAAPAVAGAVPSDAALTIDFFSEVSEGVVTIYAGDRQILRRSFSFTKSIGFLRKERISGGFQESRQIGVGDTSFRVYVTLPGRPTRPLTVSGNFPGGSKRTLRVRLDAQGAGTVALQ